MDFPGSNYINLLAKATDAYSLRQKVTASNIANIDTPGYKKLSVSFEHELRQARKTGTRPLSDVNPVVVSSDHQPVLEDEMLIMADTQMRVQLVTKALRENFELIRTGINGRT